MTTASITTYDKNMNYNKITEAIQLINQPKTVKIIHQLHVHKKCTLSDLCQNDDETQVLNCVQNMEEKGLLNTEVRQGKRYYNINMKTWARAKLRMIKFLENPSSYQNYI